MNEEKERGIDKENKINMIEQDKKIKYIVKEPEIKKKNKKNFLGDLLYFSIIAVLFFTLGQNYQKTSNFSDIENDFDEVNFKHYEKAWKELDEKHVSPFSEDFIKENNITEPTGEDKVWWSIKGLAGSYSDPYTDFFPPVQNEEFKEDVNKEFSGVGMRVEKINGLFTVVSPLPGSPAAKAGIKPKDVILKIDDKETKDLSEMEAVEKIRGEKGTEVVLKVLRKNASKTIEIKIKRDLITIPTVETKILNDISIISVYSFAPETVKEFKKELYKFSKRKSDKLIIDLRLNPGGYVEAPLLMSSFFVEGDKLLMSEKTKKVEDYSEHYSEGELHVFEDTLKLVVLVDEGSASASEIMAGILSDYKKAIIVGKKSFGKGSVQELVDFTKDTSLKLTVAKWYLPSGASVSQIGIIPDFEVELKVDNDKKYDIKNDSQVLKAIEILNKKDFFEIRKNKKTEKEKQEELKKEKKEKKEKEEGEKNKEIKKESEK